MKWEFQFEKFATAVQHACEKPKIFFDKNLSRYQRDRDKIMIFSTLSLWNAQRHERYFHIPQTILETVESAIKFWVIFTRDYPKDFNGSPRSQRYSLKCCTLMILHVNSGVFDREFTLGVVCYLLELSHEEAKLRPQRNILSRTTKIRLSIYLPES